MWILPVQKVKDKQCGSQGHRPSNSAHALALRAAAHGIPDPGSLGSAGLFHQLNSFANISALLI
jgi:hypothetical protein